MPRQPPRPCTYPGCHRLTIQGRCDKHRKQQQQRVRKHNYDHRWHKMRDHYIRHNPVCEIQQECDGDPAVEVDHIRALANGGDMHDEDNMQSTCAACHRWKTKHVDGFTGHYDRTNY